MQVESTKPAGIAYQILDFRSPVIGLIALAVIGAFVTLQMIASQPERARHVAGGAQRQALQDFAPARQIDATLILVDDAGQELLQLQLLQERDEVRAQWKEEPMQVSIVNVDGFSEDQVTLLIAAMDSERRALGLSNLLVEDWRVH